VNSLRPKAIISFGWGYAEIILLSGFKDEAKETSKSVCGVVVDDEVKLQQAAKRNPDAVAFGYVAGEWIAAA
jgi:hypothetical protein